MILYLEGVSNTKDVVVDYINATLASGEQVSLGWDESNWARENDGQFSAELKGVCFGEDDYANGRESDMIGLTVNEVAFYSECKNFSKEKTRLTQISMYYNDDTVTIWEDKK